MAGEAWLVPTITAILGGGLATTVSQILGARSASRQIKIEEDKAPADVSTVLLGGASQAVTVLTSSLKWAQDELEEMKEDQKQDKRLIKELMASNEQKDIRISDLERELRSLRVKVEEVQTALDRAQLKIDQLKGFGNGQSDA